jgi:hypothetical protein
MRETIKRTSIALPVGAAVTLVAGGTTASKERTPTWAQSNTGCMTLDPAQFR